MHVVVEDVNITDFQVLAGGWHDLHDSNRPDVAFRILVERRLLETLRQHQQVIHVVGIAILAEQRQHVAEALAFVAGGGVLHELRILDVAIDDRIAELL